MNISISIIIPVFNEININLYLERLLNNDSYENNEIIVVDGNGTTTIDLIKYDNIIKSTSIKGRANQMNKGANLASKDILLFLHADTILPKDAINTIVETMSKKNIVAGAFDLSFDSNRFILTLIAKLASWRSRLTKLPYGDQAIFIRKDIFQRIGKYEDIPLMEDVNLMQKLKKEKLTIKISEKKVITSARKWQRDGIIYTTLRNWILIGLYYLKVHPKKLAKFYN